MILEQITDLRIFGTYDRGVPNLERIVLRVYSPVHLGYYALGLGLKQINNMALPIPDQFFWLGEMVVASPAWIFVYTGSGTPVVTTERHTKEPLYTQFWGREQTVFVSPEIVPVMYFLNGIDVAHSPPQVIQPPPSAFK